VAQWTKPYTQTKIRPPIKCHGGKFYLARRLLDLAPPDEIGYLVEPFAGGASFMLNQNLKVTGGRILADLDWFRVNLLACIRDKGPLLAEALRQVQYTQETFDLGKLLVAHREQPRTTDPGPGRPCCVATAVAYLVANRMSRGGMGKAFAWSTRKRGGQPGDLNAWQTMIEQIPLVSQRLQGVKTYHSECLQTLRNVQWQPWDLIYADPTYLASTRKAPRVYAFEMDRQRHMLLATALNAVPCRVMLSGYDSDDYQAWYDAQGGWQRITFDMPNHSGQNKTKERRTEVVWLNYCLTTGQRLPGGNRRPAA